MNLINVCIRMDPVLWKEFKNKYKRNASQRIRILIKKDLGIDKQEIIKINREDIEGLKELVFKNDKPIQLVGDVGIGKTTCVKSLINKDREHVYIVFDCHDEYELPEIQTITTNLKESSRIKMPKQISASQGLFPVYFNQILSQKFPNNYVIVIEEAHRYKETKILLKEARKFVKLIAILQEPMGNYCPILKVIA